MNGIDKVVKCPYYRSSNKLRVKCEGMVEESCACTMNFRTPEERKNYMRDFCCCRAWQGCALARVIGEKYRE